MTNIPSPSDFFGFILGDSSSLLQHGIEQIEVYVLIEFKDSVQDGDAYLKNISFFLRNSLTAISVFVYFIIFIVISE